MAGAAGFAITISATDSATAAIKAVNKQLEGLRAPAEHLNKEIKKFSELSGVKALGEHIHKLGEHAREAGRHLSDIARPLGVITSAASIAGIVELTARWGEWGRQLTYAASRINIAAPALHQWEGAARLAGASAGTMTTGLETLATTLHEMKWGFNPEAVQYFTRLGFSMADAKKYASDVGAFLPILFERLNKIPDPITRIRYAQMFLGGSARELFALYSQQGVGAVQRYLQESGKLYSSTKENIEIAYQFALAQSRISLSFSHLYETAIVKLAPGMTVLMDKMTEWFSQPGTAEGLAKAIGDIALAIKDIWDVIQAGVDKIGGWGNALKWLFGLWAGKKALELASPASTPLALGAGMGLRQMLAGGGLGALGGGLAAMLATPFFGPLAGQPGPIKGFWEWMTAMRTPGQHAIREQYGPPAPEQQSWFNDPAGMATQWLRRHTTGGRSGGSPSEMPSSTQMPWPSIIEPHSVTHEEYLRAHPGVIGPYPTGTQTDPFYVRPLDVGGTGIGGGAGEQGSLQSDIWGPNVRAPAQRAFREGILQLPKNVTEAVRTAATAFKLNPDWMASLARAEAGVTATGVPRVSSAGAIGAMQLMPGTAADMGVNPWNQNENITGGMRYFQQQLRQFHGNYGVATAAYNAGPRGRGIRHYAETGDPSQLPWETQEYLRRIQGFMGGQGAPAAGPNGKAELHVTFGNAPSGTRARGSSSGDIWSGPPRVETALAPAYGAVP